MDPKFIKVLYYNYRRIHADLDQQNWKQPPTNSYKISTASIA